MHSAPHQHSAGGTTTTSASACFFARGYLLKRNRDTKSLGRKYKQRWVELTADTLVYSASQQDVLSGGQQVAVFAVGDMLWVRPEEELKFVVKFTERSLHLKVAAGGKAERDQWVAALQAAKQQHAAAEQARRSGAGRLEQLQKALLPPELDPTTSSSSSSVGHVAVHTLPSESGRLSSSAGLSVNGRVGLSLTASSYGCSMEPGAQQQQQPQQHEQQQPLSPRTLLASARAGMALVNSASPAGTPRAKPQPAAAAGSAQHPGQQAAQQFFMAEAESGTAADSGSGDDAGSTDAGDDDSQQPQQQQPQLQQQKEGAAASSHGPAAPALVLQVDSPAAAAVNTASGGTTPSSSGGTHHPSLARRVTPGVLLASSRPTTPAARTGLQQQQLQHSVAATPRAAAAAPSSDGLPASPLSAAAGTGEQPLSDCDFDYELRLDDDEADAARCASQAQASAQAQAQALAQRLLQQSLSHRPASPSAAAAAARAAAASAGFRPSAALNTASRPASSSRSSGPDLSAPHAADSLEDEILRLNLDEVLMSPAGSSSSQHHPQPGADVASAAASSWQGVGGGISSRPGALQVPLVGSRPGSAAAAATSNANRPGSATATGAYRPGTPLKSCLRNNSPNPAACFSP